MPATPPPAGVPAGQARPHRSEQVLSLMGRRSSPAPGQVQLNLSGEVEQAGREASGRETARTAWQARFERAEWVPAWTTSADGTPVLPKLGWVCPACKVVEPNEFLLGNNHGYHLHWPGHVPYRAEFGATCSRLELLAAHALYDKRRATIRHLVAVGLDDEQIAARAGFWPASMIAGYRKDDAQASRLAARAARGEIAKVPHGPDCPCAFCGGPCGCPSCESFRRTGQCAELEEAGRMLF